MTIRSRRHRQARRAAEHEQFDAVAQEIPPYTCLFRGASLDPAALVARPGDYGQRLILWVRKPAT